MTIDILLRFQFRIKEKRRFDKNVFILCTNMTENDSLKVLVGLLDVVSYI